MSLPEVWFAVVGLLFVGYFVLEGFDFGVGMLMPILGRPKDGIPGDTRRRVLLNTIGPVWDGNEVWLLTAGGATFAAFPGWYATMFTAFYLPLLLILVGLIFRVCAIEWRGKIDDPRWRKWADVGIGLGSWIPAFLWGVAFANLVRGMDINEAHQYVGGFWALLNPYSLLGGLTTTIVFLLHGAIFLALKTEGDVQKESMRTAWLLSLPATAIAAAFLLWTQLAYGKDWTWAVLLIGAVAMIVATAMTFLKREGWAFVATCFAIVATVVMILGALFPNVMPSTLNPDWSLTIANTASTGYTLTVMSWAALAVTPVVIGYQAWTYWVFRARISDKQIPASIGLSLRTEKSDADKESVS